MKQRFILLFFFLVIHSLLRAQDKLTVSGYVKDVANGEGIIGGSVYVKEGSSGAATNAYGFYSITLPKGNYTFVYSLVGYEKISKNVVLSTENVKLNIELKEQQLELQEVMITTKREDENVKSIEMSTNKMEMKTMQRMPALLGEVDVIRSIQFLPGVSTVGEGASGFNVRGGSIDQNLVLLDEAPVFNSSHLFGFFSVFNPDAVKDVKLIKGGIPAQYGGRISSILDVRLKEGNAKKTSVSGGIGLIFSRLAYERPFAKGRGSFIVAARRSYADVLARPFLKGELKGSQFYFYDFTAKANYRINDKNTIFLSGYLGRDVFGADFGFNWGNATTSFRWNHVFNDRLFMNTTVFYSNYDYLLDSDLRRKRPRDYFRWKSSIINYSVKPDFTYYLSPKNTLTFGGQAILYTFKPGTATAASNGQERTFGLENKNAIEGSFYVGNEQNIGSKLQLQYGLRYSLYSYMGPGESYEFQTDVPPGQRRFPVLSKTQKYADFTPIKTYGNLEPRFSAKYELTPNASLKASYNRIAQYLHLISNTTASTPLDVWSPSTNNIKPQIADQVALGYFQNFGANSNDYEASVEVYYKKLQNQIDYISGANLFLNKYLEGDLLAGDGRAYGAEFYVKKNKGALTGWVSYTLARTERQVEGINERQWFPTRFDKTHNLNVVLQYEASKRWNLSANFTYGTGTPATFPTNKYEVQGLLVPHNVDDARNNVRIPDYHRLDVSATLAGKKKPNKKREDSWVFSVYNTYNRRNPFSIFFRQSDTKEVIEVNGEKIETPKAEAVRYSVFGNFIPAVTYNFKF